MIQNSEFTNTLWATLDQFDPFPWNMRKMLLKGRNLVQAEEGDRNIPGVKIVKSYTQRCNYLKHAAQLGYYGLTLWYVHFNGINV